MQTITIEQAKSNDINWINVQYEDINFMTSKYDNEFIVIAKVNQKNAGLGRLVKIDDYHIELGGIYVLPNFRRLGIARQIVKTLCEENPFINTTIWCLPFDNLLNFYSEFGFKHFKDTQAPQTILKKLKWCNTGNRYSKKVVLLYKNQ